MVWLQKAADQEYPYAKEMLANVRAGRIPTASTVQPQYASSELAGNLLRGGIAEANAGVTHADFVAGAQDKRL
jgi:hypothetical protein